MLVLRAAAIAAFVALSAAPLAAQTAAQPSPSPTPLPEIGRVSTADRQDEPLLATSKTTYVVTKAQMIEHGWTTVASAIETLPGVDVERYGAFGAEQTVSIRGASSQQVLVLLDGRPVAGGQLGVVDLGAMPTTGVERIEVVEGSGSTLYGSGAIGGVINVITTRPAGAYRTPLVTIADGGLGQRLVSIETQNVSYERQLAGNVYDYPSVAGANAGTRSNGFFEETVLRANAANHLGAVRVNASAGVVTRGLGVPGSTDFLTPNAQQNDETEDARVSFTLARAHASTTLELSGTRETLVFGDPAVAEGGPYLDDDVEGTVQAGLRNAVVSDGNRLLYGVDVSRGSARNDAGGGLFAVTPFSESAIYAQDSVRLGSASRIYGGVRGQLDGSLGGAVTPELGGTFGLGGGLSLRANASTAFRVPSAVDLAYPGFSNPALQPEHARNLDVTLSSARVLGGASLGWFVQTANDLIEDNPDFNFNAPPGPANLPLINAQRTSIAGFVFDVSTLPYNGFTVNVNLTDTYRALDLSALEQRLPYHPVIGANTTFGWTGGPRSTLAAFGFVTHTAGARVAGAAAPTYTRVDGYARFRLAPRALLSLRAYDIGGERYAQYPGYPMPGRTFTVELSTR